jgi:hypothetical protein
MPKLYKTPVAVHHRSACSGVKACPWLEQGALRNTSAAKRQAAKPWLAFRSLDPSARSANLIAGDGTKNGLSAPNKEAATNQNDYLTGKAPYKFESSPLQPSSPPAKSLLRTRFGTRRSTADDIGPGRGFSGVGYELMQV